jgi:hypothetical protein
MDKDKKGAEHITVNHETYYTWCYIKHITWCQNIYCEEYYPKFEIIVPILYYKSWWILEFHASDWKVFARPGYPSKGQALI